MIAETGNGMEAWQAWGGGQTAFPEKQGHVGKGRGRDTGARTQSVNTAVLLKGCLSDNAGDQREMSLGHRGHFISD